MNYLKFLALLCLGISFSTCSGNREKKPDVSHIDSNLEILRFEIDFSQVDTSEISEGLESLSMKYPSFFEVYFQQILAERPIKPEELEDFALEILQEGYLRPITDTTLMILGETKSIFSDVDEMIRYYRYFFEDYNPKVLVTFVSEFGVGACTIGEDTLGIGLDMYLGEDFEGYDPGIFPSFVRASMNPDFIPVHLGKTMIQNKIPGIKSNRMLDIMLYNGKVLYGLGKILPDMPDHILMEYNPEQMAWVADNELQIWSHFLSNELLYSTKRQDYQKLIGPSPNAPNMPPEAPGQTANWIGWQIVKAYMNRYPQTSLQQLMEINDAQELLEKSRYRPR